MRAATLVPVEEYLSTSYDPDCEYVDGQIVGRNLGEKPHSRIQRKLIVYLDNRSKEFGIEVFPEQRVQVSPTRFRVPDVTVVRLPQREEPIVTSPPHLCIEILSKEDTMEDMQERIDDYLRFGVAYVWIISPRHKKAYVATATGMIEAASGKLETKDPPISVPLSALFE
jgi:Uma2 family endonuclease